MNQADTKLDPICGMSVPPDSKIKMEFEGREYFFCSNHCKEKFEKEPGFYLRTQAEKVEESAFKTYFPLLLVSGYLLGLVILLEWRTGNFDSMRMMTHFMGGFFLVFSFFKMLDLKGFASAFQSYDWLAQKVPGYALLYPFLELGLGIAYLLYGSTPLINSVTAVVMFVSSLGVIHSIFKKRDVNCACLGTVFQFPMSKVTLFEDLLMLVMALLGLLLS